MRESARLRGSIAGVALMVAAIPVDAGQLDSATYFALDRGMSESELLIRAGEPDLVTHPGGGVITQRSSVAVQEGADPRLWLIGAHRRDRFVEIKEYHYVPDHTEHDPHLTVVTLRGGRVFEIERTKLLTRPKAPARAASLEGPPALTDDELRIERVDRVLSAAEAYAATRARLKSESAGAAGEPGTAPVAAGQPASVYQGTGADGVPYFGDRPPAD